jgi:hypothetical protein
MGVAADRATRNGVRLDPALNDAPRDVESRPYFTLS